MKAIQISFDIVRYFLLYLFIHFLTAFARKITDEGSVLQFFAEGGILVLSIFLILLVAKKVDKVNLSFSERSTSIITSAILLPVGVFILSIAMLAILYDGPLDIHFNTQSVIQSLFFAFYVMIRAGSEEIFYRGILLDMINKNTSKIVGLILTSLLFMFAHTFFEILTFRATNFFLFGLTCGLLRYASGSILPPIIFHVIWNALAAGTNNSLDFAPLIYIKALDDSPQHLINLAASISMLLGGLYIYIFVVKRQGVQKNLSS